MYTVMCFAWCLLPQNKNCCIAPINYVKAGLCGQIQMQNDLCYFLSFYINPFSMAVLLNPMANCAEKNPV